MKIKILETEIELEKSEKIVNDVYLQVDQVLKDSSLYFNHLVIDGVKVSSEYDRYITENMDRIECIEVKADTLMEILDSGLKSGNDYLKKAIPHIKQLGNEFYQQPAGKTWKKFEQMIEGFDWIIQMLDSIVANHGLYLDGDRYEHFVIRLKDEIESLNEAISQKDMVYTGDLIIHEIVPLLESLECLLCETIEKEVTCDINS